MVQIVCLYPIISQLRVLLLILMYLMNHILSKWLMLKITGSINGGSRFIEINHIPVSKQNGSIDCGLFALGYALVLAMDIDPEMSSIL
ncbi:hypothetical protein BpHYR1_004312 [Brachionus plicatilis]|uniref:Uncharacterized protein n=1 Tax=Brachionus plicatilis TaxID=10195 RepID=A0A3M7QS43_BRAPC|nr:hypothetical protein BpHYR1_004312 [Brachionus plicatilis]